MIMALALYKPLYSGQLAMVALSKRAPATSSGKCIGLWRGIQSWSVEPRPAAPGLLSVGRIANEGLSAGLPRRATSHGRIGERQKSSYR